MRIAQELRVGKKWVCQLSFEKFQHLTHEKKAMRRIGQRMKEKSEKSSMLWKPREESISGKELGTLSKAAERLNKS